MRIVLSLLHGGSESEESAACAACGASHFM
jgi:hypothetical protein